MNFVLYGGRVDSYALYGGRYAPVALRGGEFAFLNLCGGNARAVSEIEESFFLYGRKCTSFCPIERGEILHI